MDMKRIGALIAAAALNGCAYYAKMTPDELAMQPATWMCAEYDRNQSPNIRAELTRRGTITPEEWALIDQKHIGIGMSEAALLCSWGFPSGRHGKKINSRMPAVSRSSTCIRAATLAIQAQPCIIGLQSSYLLTAGYPDAVRTLKPGACCVGSCAGYPFSCEKSNSIYAPQGRAPSQAGEVAGR